MRVLVCPTVFKGSLGASEAARAMARGVRAARPSAELRLLPISDGGPGLIEALSAVREGEVARWEVSGPVGEPVTARCLLLEGGEAILESADACGLHLLRRPAPLDAHTVGVGELVERALEAGARSVRIGLGGSASTDGGTGMARSFDYRFLDARGREIPTGGRCLAELERIEPGRPPDGTFVALVDVETPLTGPEGAAVRFGPQKGATEEEVELLARGLERLEERLGADLGVGVGHLPGSGAAGGLGAGCAAFLGAGLASGSEWVLGAVGFDDALEAADVVMTGEGAFDATSLSGKIVGRVLERAHRADRPVVLVCGRLEGPGTGARVALDADGEWLDGEGLAARVAEALRRLG